MQHWLTDFYNRDGVCLLRGTDWIFIYPQFNIQEFYVRPNSEFRCFVWIWEQTAMTSNAALTDWLLKTRRIVFYCGVWNGSLYTASLTFSNLRSAHTVYLCVMCVSENEQRLFPYTALTDFVDCGVRTGFLNTSITQVNLSSKNKLVIVNLFPYI